MKVASIIGLAAGLRHMPKVTMDTFTELSFMNKVNHFNLDPKL